MEGIEFEILYWLQSIHTPWLDWLMKFITSLGNVGWFWIVLGGVLLIGKKTRKTGAAVLISLSLGFLMGNLFLKNTIARQRPCWLDQQIFLLIENPTDFSFPSGHSLASFGAAFSIFLYHKKWGTAALILAVSIAFSRLYLFVHFPTDVLAGSLLGMGIAWAVHRAIEKRPERRFLK